MKITIELSKRVMRHLKSPHTFSDVCEPSDRVLRLVQKEIDKRYKKVG